MNPQDLGVSGVIDLALRLPEWRPSVSPFFGNCADHGRLVSALALGYATRKSLQGRTK